MIRQGFGGQVALVDYGAGNLTSVRKAFVHLGAAIWTPSAPAELADAGAIVVPGVGHFDATKAIGPEWRDAIRRAVDLGTPLLGICVGLQWLFGGSTEAPGVPGFGYFTGECAHLGARDAGTPGTLKVPHVGWNSLSFPRPSQLMSGVRDGAQVYFTHSYAAPVTDDAIATTEHGCVFASAVERENVAAVQFHPEKSGDVGLRILRNWLDHAGFATRRDTDGGDAL